MEVMMASVAKLEARPPTGMRDAAREAERDQGVQDTVDRRAGDAGHALAHGIEQVIGARMILTRCQGFHHGPALDCHGQTARSTHLLKALQGMLRRVGPTMNQTRVHYI
jgi:hypothetical protein